MTKDIEQYRPGFEAWITSEGETVGRDQRGRYVTSYTRKAWKIWIASKREASTEPSASPCSLCDGAGGEYGSSGKWWLKCPNCDGSKVEPVSGAQKDEAKEAAPADALDAAKHQNEQRSMIIGQAVAHYGCTWPLISGPLYFNGVRITRNEFNERAAIAASTSKAT